MLKNKPLTIDNDFFEKIIAYNSLTNETYLASIIDAMEPVFFKDENIKMVYAVISDFYKKRGTIPNSTELKAYLVTEDQKNAFKSVLNDVKTLETKYNFDELIQNTEKFLKEKAVYNAIIQTVDDVKNNNIIDTSKTLATFERACNISLVDDLGRDYLTDIDLHIKDLHENQSYISSGYNWLDKVMGGGFLASGRAMYIFSGVTNSGKSIILGNVATNVLAQNKKVVIISLEMPETVYSQRISAQLSKIPMRNLKNDSSLLKDFVEKYKEQHLQSKLFIKEFPPKSITVNHIKAYLDKLYMKKGFKPDVIIIDYVNLMNPTVITGKLYEDIKLISEQLRTLAYVYKCPVISATQLNRSAFDETDPGLETTSESMGLTHTADFQASIWSSDSDKELNIIHMGIQKNRFGLNSGTNAFKIDYDTLSIAEMDDDFISSNQTSSIESTLDGLLK